MKTQLSLALALTLLTGCGAARPGMAIATQAGRAQVATVAGKFGSVAGIQSAGQRLATAFMTAYDTNRDGVLSPQELPSYSLPDIHFQATAAQIDTNHDGAISAQEMAASLGSATVVHGFEVVYYQQFQGFDTDHDGQLSLAEFTAMLPKSGIGQFLTPTSLYDADKNGDNQLNPSEYEDLAFGTYVDAVLVPFVQNARTARLLPGSVAGVMLPSFNVAR